MIPKEQIKYAQHEIMKAGKELVSANMRLQGTQFEKEMTAALHAVGKLNTKLINYLKQ